MFLQKIGHYQMKGVINKHGRMKFQRTSNTNIRNCFIKEFQRTSNTNIRNCFIKVSQEKVSTELQFNKQR